MAKLDVVRYGDAGSFLDGVGEYLVAREAEHNLPLGVCGRLRSSPRLYGFDPYLAAVTRDGEVVGAALRTPPHNVVLSELDDPRAIDVLVPDVSDVFSELPGVLGPKEASRRFAELWQQRTGQRASPGIAHRVFRCARVDPPAGVPGELRRASAADRAIIAEWIDAFTAEALVGTVTRPSEEAADDYLSRPGDEGAHLWDADGPVSLAGVGSSTPSGARIGPVYTPPPLRGRGYASALTAAVTQLLHDGGRRFCFLFTDLANPTSNKIYQRIGYEPVTYVDEYRFA